jgi:hypothetical protein
MTTQQGSTGCDIATREEICGCGSTTKEGSYRKEMRGMWRHRKEGDGVARSACGRRRCSKGAEEDEGEMVIVESGYVRRPCVGMWDLDLEHGVDRHWFASTR